MPSLILSGSSPKVAQLTGLPAVYTLTPSLSRPVINVLSGWPLPIRRVEALEGAGAYLIVGEQRAALPAVYVGEGQSVEERLAGHERLHHEAGAIRVIAITAEGGDLTKADAGALERLLYLGLAEENGIGLENRDEPSHAPVDQPRFEQLCAFAADVLTRINESGLLPLSGRWREGLSGPGLCAQLLAEPPLEALIGSRRMWIKGHGYEAEALFLNDGRCLLKAGSCIRSYAAPTIATRAALHRQEAFYAGFVADMDGARIVTRDLLFESRKRVSGFVTGSTFGAWKEAAGPKTKPRSSGEVHLSLWREAAPQACTSQDAESLRAMLAKTVLFGEPDWAAARQGDVKAALRLALQVTNSLRGEPAQTGVLNLAMSAMMACAIDKTPGAADVIDALLFRLKLKGLAITAPIRTKI